jgi:hypothetical protein
MYLTRVRAVMVNSCPFPTRRFPAPRLYRLRLFNLKSMSLQRKTDLVWSDATAQVAVCGRPDMFSSVTDTASRGWLPRGAGLRKKRSRKCGCKWKVIGEALEQNGYMWTLREFADPEHSQHNHRRSLSLSAHPIHRRLTDSYQPASRDTGPRCTWDCERQTP